MLNLTSKNNLMLIGNSGRNLSATTTYCNVLQLQFKEFGVLEHANNNFDSFTRVMYDD